MVDVDAMMMVAVADALPPKRMEISTDMFQEKHL